MLDCTILGCYARVVIIYFVRHSVISNNSIVMNVVFLMQIQSNQSDALQVFGPEDMACKQLISSSDCASLLWHRQQQQQQPAATAAAPTLQLAACLSLARSVASSSEAGCETNEFCSSSYTQIARYDESQQKACLMMKIRDA